MLSGMVEQAQIDPAAGPPPEPTSASGGASQSFRITKGTTKDRNPAVRDTAPAQTEPNRGLPLPVTSALAIQSDVSLSMPPTDGGTRRVTYQPSMDQAVVPAKTAVESAGVRTVSWANAAATLPPAAPLAFALQLVPQLQSGHPPTETSTPSPEARQASPIAQPITKMAAPVPGAAPTSTPLEQVEDPNAAPMSRSSINFQTEPRSVQQGIPVSQQDPPVTSLEAGQTPQIAQPITKMVATVPGAAPISRPPKQLDDPNAAAMSRSPISFQTEPRSVQQLVPVSQPERSVSSSAPTSASMDGTRAESVSHQVSSNQVALPISRAVLPNLELTANAYPAAAGPTILSPRGIVFASSPVTRSPVVPVAAPNLPNPGPIAPIPTLPNVSWFNTGALAQHPIIFSRGPAVLVTGPFAAPSSSNTSAPSLIVDAPNLRTDGPRLETPVPIGSISAALRDRPSPGRPEGREVLAAPPLESGHMKALEMPAFAAEQETIPVPSASVPAKTPLSPSENEVQAGTLDQHQVWPSTVEVHSSPPAEPASEARVPPKPAMDSGRGGPAPTGATVRVPSGRQSSATARPADVSRDGASEPKNTEDAALRKGASAHSAANGVSNETLHQSAESISPSPGTITVRDIPDSHTEPAEAVRTASQEMISEPAIDTMAHAPVARQISLQLAGNNSANVAVQLKERAGKIEVAVHSSDTQLNRSLQSDLGDLVTKLENQGFKTQAWIPSAARYAPSTHNAGGPAASQQHPQHAGSQQDTPERREQSGEDQSKRHRKGPAFAETLEDTKRSRP